MKTGLSRKLLRYNKQNKEEKIAITEQISEIFFLYDIFESTDPLEHDELYTIFHFTSC